MKKIFKTFGIIALAAIIGFSMAACDTGGNDGGGSSGTDTALNGTWVRDTMTIKFTNGNFEISDYGNATMRGTYTTDKNNIKVQVTGVYKDSKWYSRSEYKAFYVVADSQLDNIFKTDTVPYSISGNTLNLGGDIFTKDTGGGGKPTTPTTYSLDGVWEMGNNWQVTVSGSTGTYSSFGTLSAIMQDAKNKGYVSIGNRAWQNLSSTGNLTWSGQHLTITFNSSNSNIATGTYWSNGTYTMSADGQTLTFSGVSSAGGNVTATYKRVSAYTLDGVWKLGNNWQVTVSGSTGTYSSFDTLNAIMQDAKNKGYVSIGSQAFRNLTSTGNLTWSGQHLTITFNSSSPNVATGTYWSNGTYTMSADGQTLTFSGVSSAGGNLTATYTRTTTSSGGGGTFTLTGIPAEYNGKYAVLYASCADFALIGAQSVGIITITTCRISNGSVSLPMWKIPDNSDEAERYSGNDNVTFPTIFITDYTSVSETNISDSPDSAIFDSVTFSNGSASRTWSQKYF